MNSSILNYFARKEQKFAFFRAGRRGYFPFSGGRRRASTGHVDVLPPLHLISVPSPYTNNLHFTLPPTSPVPSLRSTFNSSPFQSPFRCAILALPSSSPPSYSFSASHLHSIHSHLTLSVGVFFLLRFSSILQRSPVVPFRFTPIYFGFSSIQPGHLLAIPCHYRLIGSQRPSGAFLLFGTVNIPSESVIRHTPF